MRAFIVRPYDQRTTSTMKLVTICLLWLAILVGHSAAQEDTEDEIIKFRDFKRRHRKTYSGALEKVHFRRWKKRKAIIDQHNLNQRNSFILGDNGHADLSEEEWDTYLLGLTLPKGLINKEEVVDVLAAGNVTNRQTSGLSLDLRSNPCMPPVKIQSPCGGCWAFIATTAVEYQTCAASNRTRTPLILSEQQLIDCSASYGTKGCNGGFYSQAWDYIMAIGGQASNASYPYRAAVGTCNFIKDVTPVAGKLSRYSSLARNETAILLAMRRGPIAVSIATNTRFVLYRSGIFDDDACKNGTINHGVMLVGYGTANGTDYWIVRNSWGTSWGMGGYIFMKRNVNACRLAEYAFLATV